MRIILNHIPETIDVDKEIITVDELLRIKNFTFELLIIRINGELVKKENYSTATIAEGNNVQVIHVFGGG